MKHLNHQHTVQNEANLNKAFFVGISLNVLFLIVEFSAGYFTNSVALKADVLHNFGDLASLLISLLGMRLSKKVSTKLFTYGYKKASILASFINSIFLLFIVGHIIEEAIHRISAPPVVQGGVVAGVAFVGIIVKSISAYLFYKGQKNDINIKAVFIHLIVDVLVMTVVVFSGVLMYFTNWNMIDVVLSFMIAGFVLFSALKIFRDSLRLILDGVPSSISVDEVSALLLTNSKVMEVNELHVWALSSTENALTVHLFLHDGANVSLLASEKTKIKNALLAMNIQHVTIETD